MDVRLSVHLYLPLQSFLLVLVKAMTFDVIPVHHYYRSQTFIVNNDGDGKKVKQCILIYLFCNTDFPRFVVCRDELLTPRHLDDL